MNENQHKANPSRAVLGKKWRRNVAQLGAFTRTPYTADDRETWRILFEKQHALLKHLGCRIHLAGYEKFGLSAGQMPDTSRMNQELQQQCGWKILEVDGMVENEDYFHLTGRGVQPFTPLIRGPEERDFFAWPDIFHELCHLPPLFIPEFGEFSRALGALGESAYTTKNEALVQRVARIYWHLVEYGAVTTINGAPEFYGALLTGNHTEAHHLAKNPDLLRNYRSLEEVATAPLPWDNNSGYDFHEPQKQYFSIPSFSALLNDFHKWSSRQ